MNIVEFMDSLKFFFWLGMVKLYVVDTHYLIYSYVLLDRLPIEYDGWDGERYFFWQIL